MACKRASKNGFLGVRNVPEKYIQYLTPVCNLSSNVIRSVLHDKSGKTMTTPVFDAKSGKRAI